MAPESPSPGEKPKLSVTKRITRGFEVVKRVLQSDIGELRKSIAGVLKQKGVNTDDRLGFSEQLEQVEPVFVKPTEKNPGMLDFRASKRLETGRTPRHAKELLPLTADALKEDRSVSEGFTEVFRRMSELAFVPNTNPIYAFMSEMFLHIRIRADDLQADKTFDQIFDEQIRWYCEEQYLSQRKAFSPALAFHWNSYYQSPESERYEDNLSHHSNPEIQLYGILMRSCFRVFDQFIKKMIPEGVAPVHTSPVSKVLMTDADQAEGGELRGRMKKLGTERSPWLLLDHGLSSYFEEDLPEDIKKDLDTALPKGLDGLYLFDTNLFVSALMEMSGSKMERESLGNILNTHSIDEACAQSAGIHGFFRFPTEEENPERISARNVAVKNAVFWKRMGDKDFYDALAQSKLPNETSDFDYNVSLMETTDFKYLSLRVAEAFQASSNIFEVLTELLPDFDAATFTDGAAMSFVSTRLQKIAVAARTLLGDEEELKEVVVGFFGILSQSDFSVWNKAQPKLKNRTPFQHLKLKSKRSLEAKDEKGVDWKKSATSYESQWKFLNQPAEEAWDRRSESYYSRMKRLSGWRMGQRNVRLKLLDDVFQKMGWNYKQHILDEQGNDWWMTLEQNRMNGQTKRQLTLPFMTPQGKVLVCRFPELQR
jgi:hypothetical protein